MSHFEMVVRLAFKLIFAVALLGGSVKSHASSGKVRRAPAAINHAAMMVTRPSKIFYGEHGTSLSPDLIVSFHQARSQEKPFDFSKVIPLDMTPTKNSQLVFSRVADRSLSSFLNSPEIRQSAVGRAATEVEQKMKQEVVIGGGDPKSISHKLNFHIQAFQTTAEVEYTGLTKATLKYVASENRLALEVCEKAIGSSDMVLSHSIVGTIAKSEVSMRWTF